jgi:hypothetical protein
MAKIVHPKDLSLNSSRQRTWKQPKPLAEVRSTKSGQQMETPANDRGRLLYLYFQCIEIDRVKRHISEECVCHGFKLKLDAVRGRHEI